MRSITPSPSVAAASVLLGLGLLAALGLLLCGCAGDRAVAPERTWEEVRYHWSDGQGDDAFGDLTVRSSGEMVWELRGQRAPTWGLLAGENLETLTRLIDALPPADYQGQSACGRRFFVCVMREGEASTFAAGDCDDACPAAVRLLAAHFDRWATAVSAHKGNPVPFRVLLQGEQSLVGSETRRLAGDRDELLGLLDLVGPSRPLLMPAVDFQRESVVGIFIGRQPSKGYAVMVSNVYRTDAGQIVVVENRIAPEPGCPAVAGATAPYIFVAFEGKPGDCLLSEVTTVVQPCLQGAASP